MATKTGTVTYGTTGLKTIVLGTTSTGYAARFVVQNKYGVNEGTLRHVSIGEATAATQRATSYLKNGTTFNADSTTKCISHWEDIGGVPTEVLAATFDSFTSNGIKLNITTANNAYLIYLTVDY